MKRLIACFLTVVMIFSSFPAAAFATAVQSEKENGQALENEAYYSQDKMLSEEPAVDLNKESDEAALSESGNEVAFLAESSVPLSGKMEVEMSLPLPVRAIPEGTVLSLVYNDSSTAEVVLSGEAEGTAQINGQSFQYKIKKLGQKIGSDTTKVESVPVNEGDPIYYLAINLTGLPTGTYKVFVQKSNLLSVETTVDLTTDSQRLELQEGTVLAGDVNKDSLIDQEDYQQVFSKIDTKDQNYDLNRDGTVDITDLVYVKENMGKTPKIGTVTPVGKIIDPTQVNFDERETLIEGTLETLFDASAGFNVVSFQKTNKDEIISEGTPLKIPMEFNTETTSIIADQIRIVPNELTTDNAPQEGTVEIEYADGTKQTANFGKAIETEYALLTEEATKNTIVVNLEKQTAIKKVTLNIFGTVSNSNLVEISKVEFLNNVKDKIVEQASTVPANLRAISGDETITVSWDPQPNVTGYEVKWTYIDVKTGKNTEKSEVVDGTSLEMKELDNFTEYTIMVQALNGDWRSGYSAPVKAIPVPAAVPEKPEGINLAGGYKQITVSWEKQKNSTGYNVYYRVKGEGDYQKIGDLVAFKYIITELKDQTEYEIYLTGYNAIGEGAKSSVYTCKTQSISPPKTPDYKLINTNNGVINQKTDHILSVEYPSNKTEDEFDIVDNDYTSYWNLNGWDAGGYNTGKPAPIVEFDEAYEMDSMILVRGDNEPSSYAYAKIRYWDENGKMTQLDQGKGFSWSQRKDTDGKEYYEVRLNNKAKIKKIQISTALYWAGAPNARNRISELKFYYYDSLANEVDALYSDDLHIELKEDVTMDKVDGLIERANTVDSISGEYHPQRETLLNDLNLAKDLLNDQANLKGIVTVDQNLSNNKNGNLQFAMALNDYQPLGVAAKAGDKVTVYVGTNGNNLPKLVCTQFYADVKTGWSTEITLKKGRNEITIPQIGGMDSERGGALYVRYPYNTASNSPIKVRIANAITIPVLNTAGMKEEQEIKDAIKTYLDDLKIYVNQKLPEIYGTADAKTSYGWNQASSIYNTTDLVSDRVMLTLPANAVLNELNKKASESDQINQLYDNIKGFDQLTEIAYKNWRGLEEGTNAGKNALPGSRINIRYARMFTGAFMYAAGAHIGIEYGSTSGVITGKPNTKGHDGTWSGGNLYGWGIAHEIGHVMDQSNGIYDETSNNVLSLYAQTYDEKTKARIEYKDVYKKVTSGTKGISNNVFTQLGMFWQLHLAYDTKANDPGNTNTFQDRLSRAYRENKTSIKDKDNLLICMASDAAGKDLTEYFGKWGLSASQETLDYVKKYEKEERAIYYLNDEARHKRDGIGRAKVAPMKSGTKVEATLEHVVENGKDNKTVQLAFNVTGDQNDQILGYEIYRNDQIIGFTNDQTYTDVVSSVNNRVMRYKVVAYDNSLNKTEAFELEPIKISHNGSIDKSRWEISSSMTSEEDKIDDDSVDVVQKIALNKLMNNDYMDVYKGDKTSNNPEIIINTNQNQTIAGFKYTAAVEGDQLAENTIKGYTIYVSEDGSKWTEATKGKFEVTAENPQNMVYFNEKGQSGAQQLVTYRAQYVKIVADRAAGISAAEIDIIGPPGDNVEMTTDGMGILEEDFKYGNKDEDIIKKGALVFTGDYRGHPAYNSVLLFDQDGNNVVGKTAESTSMIIMAEIPPNGNVGETSSGKWVYWIEPGQYDLDKLPSSVTARLYRVDNMDTQEGQRLVSDTLSVPVPKSLPNIKLTGAVIPDAQTGKVN